ncbi:hypothetical protein [Labrys sp. (in: a-proteobacteria)]|uniref:hypothetical protein n=1 Tax=Labrys sp. (in: a-proteobacteria) TaxID=1917972 RepID=UPI0039E2B4EF
MSRLVTALIAGMLVTASQNASAEKIGNWETMFAQGIYEVTNTNKNGDQLIISCGHVSPGDQNAHIIVVYKNLEPSGYGISYTVDGEIFLAIRLGDNDFVVSEPEFADRLKKLQKAIMKGRTLTATVEGYPAVTFDLQGAKRALGDVCEPQVPVDIAKEETPPSSPKNAADLEIKRKITSLCRERWTNEKGETDWVMLNHCTQAQTKAYNDTHPSQE